MEHRHGRHFFVENESFPQPHSILCNLRNRVQSKSNTALHSVTLVRLQMELNVRAEYLISLS